MYFRNALGGGGGEGIMTLDELDIFEKQLEIWICQVRSTKVKLIKFPIKSICTVNCVLYSLISYHHHHSCR